MNFDLVDYMSRGIEGLVKDTLKVTFRNPKQSAFFLQFAISSKKATERRRTYEKNGEHIPSFLIASITNDCNLNCVGCYAMANNPGCEIKELQADVWKRIFDEADELGISIIMLAGGEPMLRSDVLKEAAKKKGILFPVFTNGTILDGESLSFFSSYRNLVPIISIEGNESVTDLRRGKGVYSQAEKAISKFQDERLLYGISVTVTSENLDTVIDIAFVEELIKYECKVLIYVEYVPVDVPDLALNDEDREKLGNSVNDLRKDFDDIIIVSFPGDEAESGGCLAAGRGFAHINAAGGVEPCPFSPYSDLNLKDVSLREALKSPLFTHLKEDGILTAEHTGGCVLFEQEDKIASLASNIDS